VPLTNRDNEKLTSNPQTDVTVNTPEAELAARKISPEAALLLNRSLVARPLSVPDRASIQIKNMEFRYRWVNRLSENGRMYMRWKSMGFTDATQDDVDILDGNTISESSGQILSGDRVLMKIRADLYDAAIKFNIEKAMRLQRARGVYFEGASSDVMSDAKPQRMTVSDEPFARQKARPFIPENADSIIDDSIRTGRVQQSRKQIEELREKYSG
jgi:hypothetical protein